MAIPDPNQSWQRPPGLLAGGPPRDRSAAVDTRRVAHGDQRHLKARLSLCCRDQDLDEVLQLHANPASAQGSRAVDVRQDAVVVERAGIANGSAVRGSGA